LKRIEIVGASEVKVKPFIVGDFVKSKAANRIQNKITKKELKHLADSIGLIYDEAELVFAKKLLNAYLAGK